MDLILWTILLGLSLIFVALGLFRNEHSELSIVGFFFLFILSTQLLFSNVTYVVGQELNTTYEYTDGNLTKTIEVSNDIYDDINLTSGQQRRIGLYMAIASVVGFVGIFATIRRAW